MRARSVARRPRSRSGDAELAGGNIDPGERELIGLVGAGALAGNGGEIVVGAGRQQRVLGQRARRDQPDDAAADDRFRPTLPGLGRVLDLLADGDAIALGDQFLEILVGGVDGHAAHRNVVALMLAALGESDAKRPRGDLGVGEEHLVEIAHPVEQQAIRIGRLDLQILRHHRRRRREIGGRAVAGFRIGAAGIHRRHAIRRRANWGGRGQVVPSGVPTAVSAAFPGVACLAAECDQPSAGGIDWAKLNRLSGSTRRLTWRRRGRFSPYRPRANAGGGLADVADPTRRSAARRQPFRTWADALAGSIGWPTAARRLTSQSPQPFCSALSRPSPSSLRRMPSASP